MLHSDVEGGGFKTLSPGGTGESESADCPNLRISEIVGKPDSLEIIVRETEIEREPYPYNQAYGDQGPCNNRWIQTQQDADREDAGPGKGHDAIDGHEDGSTPNRPGRILLGVVIGERVQTQNRRNKCHREQAQVNPGDRILGQDRSCRAGPQSERHGNHEEICSDRPVKVGGFVPTPCQGYNNDAIDERGSGSDQQAAGSSPQGGPNLEKSQGRKRGDVQKKLLGLRRFL